MRDVVIVPCFDRPEYLYVCIEQIKKADRAEEMKYLFAADFGFKAHNLDIINDKMKGYDYEVLKNNGSRFKSMKQSYNVLESYRRACEITDGFIFLIEDDIFIAKSFFTNHYEIHEQHPGIFCSIAAHLQNEKELQTLELNKNGVTQKSVYQSWGVCWKKDVLQNLILPHANESYYRSPDRYLIETFPDHFLKDRFSEQDGLIRRVHDTSGLKIGFPDYPRAFHCGVWGYHRSGGKITNSSFAKKLEFIYDTCFSHEKMQKYNIYNDVFITDLAI